MSRTMKWLLVVALIGWGGILLSVGSQWRAAMARQTTKSRMKQLQLALLSYHDQYESFPPAFVQGPDGRMWHSWRTLLLPHLGEVELAAKYRFDEPWDGPHNRELVAACPKVYQSPHWGQEAGRTNFFGVIGRRTAWPAQHAIEMSATVDGTSNTIHLVEGPPVSTWTEPRDMNSQDWIQAFRSPGRQGSHISTMDGTVRYLPATIDQSHLLMLLTPKSGLPLYSGLNWPEEWSEAGEPSFVAPAWKTRDVRAMEGTDVLAAALAPLNSEQNQLWCATSQIAWDELRSPDGGPVVTTPGFSIAEQLNAERFNRQSLSPTTYVASTTGGSAADTQALLAELQRKFPQTNVPIQEIPDDDGMQGLRFFACLIKSMPFENHLDRFTTPLEFQSQSRTTPVTSFGRLPTVSNGIGDPIMTQQLQVADYISDEDFVLILNTGSQQHDQIVLTHGSPGKSLRAMWKDVAARLDSPHPHRIKPHVHSGERVEIPCLEFGLTKSFDELIGMPVGGFAGSASFSSATASMLFRLDEKGVELQSVTEYHVIGEFGEEDYTPPPFDPTKPRKFVFDRPFFLALREKGASEPYFLAWIAHPEIMVRIPTL